MRVIGQEDPLAEELAYTEDDDSLMIIQSSDDEDNKPSSTTSSRSSIHKKKNTTPPKQDPKEAEQRADQLRKQFRKNIKELSERKRPLNILILGKPSQGKSAFLNSTIIGVSKKWGQYVMDGKHGGQGGSRSYMTANLTRLNVMDPKEGNQMLDRAPETDEEEIFLRKHSPRFFDLAGMPDENNERTREVFRRILYGGIPLDTSLLQVVKESHEENGAAKIRNKYWTRNDELAIDRVVVVMSTVEEFPKLLVEAMMSAAQPKGVKDPTDGYIYKRAVPVFGLITMMDKLEQMSEKEIVSFKQREKDFIASLGMIGSTQRLGRCTNYFNEDAANKPRCEMENNPDKDCQILTFLDYLMDPYLKVDHETDVPIRPIDYMLPFKMFMKQLETVTPTELFIAFLVLVIAILFVMVIRLSMKS